MRIGNENPQIPSGTRRTADADAVRHDGLRIWATEFGSLDKRVPTPPLAARGHLTLNT